jgi:hypothetical protein
MPATPRAVALRSSDTGPLLRPSDAERRATVVATAAGFIAAAWVWSGPGTRELDELVRASVALPAFAMGFGVVMVGMAAASDLRFKRR